MVEGIVVRILILHGPNLNLLGTREPAVYGTLTLGNIDHQLSQRAQQLGVSVDTFQTNHEGELLDRIHAARGNFEGILMNAGAFCHTSIALRDAISAVALPVVEVHLSNTAARETFRHHSYVAEVARGVVAGFGPLSYLLGLDGLVEIIRSQSGPGIEYVR
ncbi:MAG: type II 3-dehydroquinate dehydratase [Myxococcales bacterium]|nr:type II 3-dehydroquinate dehydratase [Myxococcales bacterium]